MEIFKQASHIKHTGETSCALATGSLAFPFIHQIFQHLVLLILQATIKEKKKLQIYEKGLRLQEKPKAKQKQMKVLTYQGSPFFPKRIVPN